MSAANLDNLANFATLASQQYIDILLLLACCIGAFIAHIIRQSSRRFAQVFTWKMCENNVCATKLSRTVSLRAIIGRLGPHKTHTHARKLIVDRPYLPVLCRYDRRSNLYNDKRHFLAKS